MLNFKSGILLGPVVVIYIKHHLIFVSRNAVNFGQTRNEIVTESVMSIDRLKIQVQFIMAYYFPFHLHL